jgi:glycosyltransferase involved in cell wall biosynthesis
MNRRSLNPWREAKLLVYLTQLYAREKPDLVHHFTIKCVIYGSIAARFAGIKAQVNAVTGLGHVFTTDSWRTRLLKPFVRRLLRFALQGQKSRLVLQNPDDKQAFLTAQLISSENIYLIRGSGVDTEKFKLSIQKKNSVFKILLATRLLWEKGIKEYVEAASIVKQKYPTVEFLLAGSPDSGNPASVAPEQIAIWEREGIITVLGHVDNMDDVLSQVNLVVLPSYREGVPRSLLEAAACGLPIVTTDVPGCREIVEHAVNGLLVPPKDSFALAKAIQYMIENPEKQAQMGMVGREKVLAEFDQKNCLRENF